MSSKNTQYCDFSFRIEKIRESLSLKAKDMAADLGISPNTFHNYKSGRIPPADLISNIAILYKVNCCWLLTGEGEMFPESQSSPSSEDTEKYNVEIEELRNENKQLKLKIEELKSNKLPPDTELLASLQKATMEIIELSREKRELQEQLANTTQSSSESGSTSTAESDSEVARQLAQVLKEYKELQPQLQQNSENIITKEDTLPLPPEEWPEIIPNPQKTRTVVIEPLYKKNKDKTKPDARKKINKK